jgi:hypothetical protein
MPGQERVGRLRRLGGVGRLTDTLTHDNHSAPSECDRANHPGAGHHLQVEEPDVVGESVLDFFARRREPATTHSQAM